MIVTQPGEWRVSQDLKRVCREESVELEVRDDRHFYTTPADFEAHAEGRKSLRMEYFYRELRKRFGVLMDDGKPAGGDWDYLIRHESKLRKNQRMSLQVRNIDRIEQEERKVIQSLADQIRKSPAC